MKTAASPGQTPPNGVALPMRPTPSHVSPDRTPQLCSAAQNMHQYLRLPVFAVPPEAEEMDWGRIVALAILKLQGGLPH